VHWWTSFITHLKENWMACSACEEPVIGCSQVEIDELMKIQRVNHLPDLYRQFMSALGREDGGLGAMNGAELCYPFVLNFKDDAYCSPLLKSLNIRGDAFVFMTDRASFLYYFHTSVQQDDPIVYSIRESSKQGMYHESVKIGLLTAVLVSLIETCF